MSIYVCIFQLRVVAFDSTSPKQQATAVVTIRVTRNENGPIFTRNTYSTMASETMALGAFVAQVNATDRDGVSNHFNKVMKKV